eukprot:Polyplicarium_translucidae@DN5440_c0_g1_i1.p1
MMRREILLLVSALLCCRRIDGVQEGRFMKVKAPGKHRKKKKEAIGTEEHPTCGDFQGNMNPEVVTECWSPCQGSCHSDTIAPHQRAQYSLVPSGVKAPCEFKGHTMSKLLCIAIESPPAHSYAEETRDILSVLPPEPAFSNEPFPPQGGFRNLSPPQGGYSEPFPPQMVPPGAGMVPGAGPPPLQPVPPQQLSSAAGRRLSHVAVLALLLLLV